MDALNAKFNFNHLSVADLVEARDLFHVHLLNKRNVVATAVGRYRIRTTDPWPNEEGYAESLRAKAHKQVRRLDNSEVREYSWPCILVFITKWQAENELVNGEHDDIVPRSIYLPDGRIVPICIVEAPRAEPPENFVDDTLLKFPANYVGGGFPLLSRTQGQERVASIGCLVTDGNKYYALTNRHVVGEAGTPLYTQLRGVVQRVGVASSKQLGKLAFQEVYPGWVSKNMLVNHDVGLVEIDDVNQWKTEVLGVGEIGEMVNLSTTNITLGLISARRSNGQPNFPQLKAFGAVSGANTGEIVALFYRYKSIGGVEYVSDLLIGGVQGAALPIRHGDSGTLWLLESGPALLPLALHWGQHNFVRGREKQTFPLGLATILSNVCVKLDVELVRGWNVGTDYSWGKTGHFKIAAKACELTTEPALDALLRANQRNIGYTNGDLLSDRVVSGSYTAARDQFVPLADVADIIWRSTRKLDASNHFADIDESHPQVHHGATLLDLCLADARYLTIDAWREYFAALDAVQPADKPRAGALPFRVWQMYRQMVASLQAGNVAEFICAGGTMAHYVGDACQPLHISYLHHGRTPAEKDVHSAYETDMLDRNKAAVLSGVDQAAARINPADEIDGSGQAAALLVLQLMKQAHHALPPEEICDVYTQNAGNAHRLDAMWTVLGDRTITNIAAGCRTMALLWQSAWKAGRGDQLPAGQLGAVDQDKLKALYNNLDFVPSFRLKDEAFKAACS